VASSGVSQAPVGEQGAEDPSGSRFSHAWRALRHRNFKLFVAGQSVSLIGTWMTRLATSWLVYRLTHSALLLGIVGFVGQILTFLLAPFAGVWVERMDRRKLLVWTQVGSAVQSLAMAWLTLAGKINIAEILLLSSLQGLVNAFDMPARQAFTVQMVEDRADLGNAIALNSSMVNLARLIGPALAGIVIGAYGEGWCFLIDGVSYFAVIASLEMMRVKPLAIKRHSATMIEQMREGWDYVRAFRPIRTVLLLFAILSLMGWPYAVLLPIFAGQILHGGPHTLGWLTGASGVGALAGALMLAVRKSVVGLTSRIRLAAGLFGAGLIAFGFSHVLWVSLLLMLVVGWGMMTGLASSNTIIQTLVPEDKRGRVMSYYTMAFVGMAPFGSLLAGSLAHVLGAPRTVMITGACCLAGCAWFTTEMPKIRKVMKPIYEEMGILAPKGAVPVEEQARA
jgi:MFS family permease